MRIHGSGFRLELVTTLDGKASPDPFSVRVGALPLTTAVLRDSGLIEATLPDQLAPGVYPVTVSIGSRQAVLEGGVQVLAPIGLALQAPANLGSGQGQPFGLSVSSRATTPVRISLESAGLTPAGAAAMSALLLPSALQPEETVPVVGTLTSLRPAQGVNVRLAVAVGWSLGPLSGVVEASAPVVLEARAALSLSLSATPAARVSAGLQRLQLTLTASNTGGAGLTLNAVAAPSLLATGTAAATLATSSAPPGQTVIAGGTSQSFTWQYDVSGSGTLTFTGSASGVEQGSGAALTPPSVTQASGQVVS